MMRAMGFGGTARIGPGWRKRCEPKENGGLRSDFARLLALPFSHLLPSHGHPLRDSAKESLAERVKEIYGE
jgi:hypothetical protein